MAAATAHQRHAARARSQLAPGRPQRRVSGPARVGTVSKPRAVPAPRPATGVFERLRGLPDHRIIDRLLRGRAWICFVGVALMGIVAMQVSLLKLNSGIGRAVEATATLDRQNSEMEASIARLDSGERIRAAADQHGMVTPDAGSVHYLRIRSGGDAARAAQRMRAPSDAARELMASAGVVPGSLAAPAATTTAPATTTMTAAPATTAAPAVTPAPTAAAVVTPAPTAAPVSQGQPSPTAAAPSSGNTVAAAPTPPQG
jgi:cell division protein FtsL